MDKFQEPLETFVSEYFNPPAQHVEYTLARQIKRSHPEMQGIVLLDPNFPLPAYLKTNDIEVKLTTTHSIHQFVQSQNKLLSNVTTGRSDFEWKSTAFIVYKFTWPQNFGGVHTMYILLFLGSGKDEEERNTVGKELLTIAYKWSLAVKEEIWIFSDGCWKKDKKLWKAIQLSGWENLVLDPEFTAGLKRDTETFFSGREIYASLGITWKRGILLLGPAGNGKTESIKVLLKETQIPALYVKSFTSAKGEEAGIRSIFEFARSQAPCILVLEDLDSMVTPSLRAFFLNELDGLEENEGILTIATSNHPEKIDDAILNRPSRFDVKYTFELPSYALRKRYIEKWIVKTRDANGITFEDEEFMAEMAKETEGFSFAFLKELFVSFLLRTAHDRALGKEAEDYQTVMKDQIKQLVVQIEMGKKVQQDGKSLEEAPKNAPGMQRALRVIRASPRNLGMENAGAGW